MKNLIKTLLAISLMLAVAGLQAAEAPPAPQRAEKRKQLEIESVSIELTGESKKTKIQPVTLVQLPPDVHRFILSFLVTAPGRTKEARLQAAAEKIRDFMTLNKNFIQYLEDEDLNGLIILELAKRYTDNDINHAADALHTYAGNMWFSTIELQLKQALAYNNLPILSAILMKHPSLANMKIAFPDEEYKFLTPLMIAAFRGHVEMVKFLLSIPGININQQDSLGRTALILTYTSLDVNNPNKAEIIALLKALGANNAREESEED
jgi:hypothetical protein